MPRGKRRKNKEKERSVNSPQRPGDVVPLQADTPTTLVNIHQNSSQDIQHRVMAMMERAMFFLFWGNHELSFKESEAALNLSKEEGFQDGICRATLLMLITLERKGDITAAFLLAVSLKATHFEVAKPHVRRLREILKRSISQSFKLAKDLRIDLMSSGIALFKNGAFREAVEHFIEVVRVFSVFNRDPHFYLARCQLELGESFKAKENCQKVLQHHPDDDEARNLMESIDATIPKQNKDQKGTKKKKSTLTAVSDAPSPVKFVPDKKPDEDFNRYCPLMKLGYEQKTKKV